jgi:hypothetical protein
VNDIEKSYFENFSFFGNSVNFGGKSVKIGDKLKTQFDVELNFIFIEQT